MNFLYAITAVILAGLYLRSKFRNELRPMQPVGARIDGVVVNATTLVVNHNLRTVTVLDPKTKKKHELTFDHIYAPSVNHGREYEID
tara:strand:- start:3221 stop:3481 length:261 start_codon:yes stop_codon:yes gene_type:complete